MQHGCRCPIQTRFWFEWEASGADSGTVTLTVNGVTAATTNYGEGSTPDTIADGLADGIVSGSPVSLTADDDTIALTSTTQGSNTDYSYSLNIQSTAGYTTPSFTASPASGSLQGGADANTTGEEVYYYNVTYEPNSNVSGYGDEVMGTWAFTYDTLNRLAGSQGSQSGNSFTNYCWSYDQFGNRTQQLGATTAFPSSVVGQPLCTSSQPSTSYNANNRILTSPTGAPVYDASGDITTGTDGNVYLYDAEGRICAVNRGGIMKGYVYDASGTRVAKGPITTMSCDPTTNGFETSGEESDYIHDQSGRPVTKTTMNSNGTMQWNYTNVYANGVLFATYDQQGLHFQLNDWLGTRRVTTDSAGVVEQTCASLPYGDQLNCSGSDDAPNEQHFTGKTHDDESGLDYFGARYYSENDARFMSPDYDNSYDPPEPVPYTNMGDPQTLNRYTYTGNSPLTNIDIDGHGCQTSTYTMTFSGKTVQAAKSSDSSTCPGLGDLIEFAAAVGHHFIPRATWKSISEDSESWRFLDKVVSTKLEQPRLSNPFDKLHQNLNDEVDRLLRNEERELGKSAEDFTRGDWEGFRVTLEGEGAYFQAFNARLANLEPQAKSFGDAFAEALEETYPAAKQTIGTTIESAPSIVEGVAEGAVESGVE